MRVLAQRTCGAGAVGGVKEMYVHDLEGLVQIDVDRLRWLELWR
jgi:hypothetical protein